MKKIINNNLINFKDFKKEIKSIFRNNNIDIEEVDYLFKSFFNVDSAKLHFIENITIKQKNNLLKIVRQRLKGKPLTKIFKSAYFYGDKFFINKHVLSPRQDTEILVEQVIKNITDTNSKILDIGTGSGIIAIEICKHTNSNVTAVDISSKALRVAKRNAKLLNTDVKFIKSDLFKNVIGTFDIIVSNPPYISKTEINNLDIEVKKHDPILALDGGMNGIDFYENIINQAQAYLNPQGMIFFEVGIHQAPIVENLLQNNFKNINIVADYNGINRVVFAKIKENHVRQDTKNKR